MKTTMRPTVTTGKTDPAKRKRPVAGTTEPLMARPPMGKMARPNSPGNSAFGHSQGNGGAMSALNKYNSTSHTMSAKKAPMNQAKDDNELQRLSKKIAKSKTNWR